MIKIFISYSNEDSNFANKLASDLSLMDIDIFFAKLAIKVGDSIVEKINKALEAYDNLVVILSRNSVNSDWVKREINSTLMRQLANRKIKIKPILLEDCIIPPLLSDIKYADFRESYNLGLKELIDSFEPEIQKKLELEMYLKIINDANLNVNFDNKILALILKRLNPIPFFKMDIYSNIYDSKSISYNELLKKYNDSERLSIFIDELLSDELIESNSIREEIHLKMTELGNIVYRCLEYGFNEGIFSSICSS